MPLPELNAFFKDTLATDNSSVEISGLSANTKPGAYALAKSGGAFTLNGASLSNSGNDYTSSSGDTNGMILTISDNSITSANIYYGESLLTKINDSLSQLLTYNGDIETRITNLRSDLSDIPEREVRLQSRIDKLTQRYAMQYGSMEGIMASLKDTGDMISNMLEKPD